MASHTPTTMTRIDLLGLLSAIGLRRVATDLDDILARATKHRWSPQETIEEVARHEQRDRERRSLERRLRAAKIGRFKPMADFDWNWPQSIDRDAIDRALTGDLVASKDNLILVAAQGLGKTMILRNLVHQAVLRGYSALYVEASRMLLDLGSQETPRALDRRLRFYARPIFLAIDEVGYLSYDARAADLLFEVVSRRYESKSIAMATNLAFADWPTVFPNATCVTALVDRLTHHADIVLIEGESYRKREAEQARKARKARKTTAGTTTS
jgi:DNA replication protein DnaC